jgi:hypothetical protein
MYLESKNLAVAHDGNEALMTLGRGSKSTPFLSDEFRLSCLKKMRAKVEPAALPTTELHQFGGLDLSVVEGAAPYWS